MINYLPPEILEHFEYLKKIYPDLPPDKIGKTITFQVTEDCCLACTYCYQHKKSNNKMTFSTAKNIIDNLLTDKITFVNSQNTLAVVVDFIGGEPFMEIDLIDQICDYMISSMIKMNHPWLPYIRFSICSNGILYKTKKVQDFFKKYNEWISFSISIDGNKYLHDKCRIDLKGNGSYDRAIEAVHLHRKLYNDLPGTKMTLAPENIMYTKEALLNLINEGYTFIPFNCIFEEGWNISHAKILYQQLVEIADYLIQNNLYNKINLKMFQEKNFQPLSEEDNQNWCGGVNMNMIAFNYKGDIFPCIRYMESSLNDKQKAIKVGNVYSGVLSNQEEKDNLNLISNITRKSQSTEECFYCPIAKGCSWCSGYNYEKFGTPNKRATYICIMHQAQCLANVYYWNKLYNYLNIDKKFPCLLPKEKALQIINENEYNYLKQISE